MEYGVSYYCLKPVTYPEIKQKLANIRQMLEQEKYKGQPENPKEEASIKQKQIRKIKEYIEANYKDVTLEDLAEHMKKNSCISVTIL